MKRAGKIKQPEVVKRAGKIKQPEVVERAGKIKQPEVKIVMTDCPRNFTREEMIAGLKAGRTLNVDRRDAPELQELLELERQGLVTSRLVVIDGQSSVLKFWWKERLR